MATDTALQRPRSEHGVSVHGHGHLVTEGRGARGEDLVAAEPQVGVVEQGTPDFFQRRDPEDDQREFADQATNHPQPDFRSVALLGKSLV